MGRERPNEEPYPSAAVHIGLGAVGRQWLGKSRHGQAAGLWQSQIILQKGYNALPPGQAREFEIKP